MEFPERVYTKEEVKLAKQLTDQGYKHNLQLKGTPEFTAKIEKTLELIKTAGYYDFLRTYIRTIKQIEEGLSQLREQEAAIWFNLQALTDPIEDAGFIIQKTQQMKDFIDGKLYYETAELKAVNKRLEFVETLKQKTDDPNIKKQCTENLKRWNEQPFP